MRLKLSWNFVFSLPAAFRGGALLLLALLLAGCPANSDRPEPPPREKVVIKGSNTFGEELGPRLVPGAPLVEA